RGCDRRELGDAFRVRERRGCMVRLIRSAYARWRAACEGGPGPCHVARQARGDDLAPQGSFPGAWCELSGAGRIPGQIPVRVEMSSVTSTFGYRTRYRMNFMLITPLFESRQKVAHRDRRRFDSQPSLSGHCGHGPIFIEQRSVANDQAV